LIDTEYVQCAHSVCRVVCNVYNVDKGARAMCVLLNFCVFYFWDFPSQDTHVDGGSDSSETWLQLRKITTWTVDAIRVRLFSSRLLVNRLSAWQCQGAVSCTGAGGAVVHDRLAAVSEPLSC